MAEVGGKFWQFPGNVQTGAIPLDKSASRKTVPEVLQPWSTPIATVLPCGAQTDRAGDPYKHATGRTSIQALAAFANEECLTQP